MTTPGFVHTREAVTVGFFGTRMRILVSGEQTGGAFCVIEVRSPAGNTTPLHVHRRETETIHLLEGAITSVIDGHPVEVAAGDTVVLPPNVPHQLITGPQASRSLLFCTPAGFDGFVRAIASDAAITADPAGMARAVAVAADYGIEISTR